MGYNFSLLKHSISIYMIKKIYDLMNFLFTRNSKKLRFTLTKYSQNKKNKLQIMVVTI